MLVPINSAVKGAGIFFKNKKVFPIMGHKNRMISEGMET
jgi:hypothetical protein